MKKLLLISLAAIALAAPSLSYADEHEEEIDRPRHFEVAQPENWSEALTELDESREKMASAYAKNDLNTLHRLSYNLEMSALEMIEEIEELQQLIEVVHHASEDNEPEKVAKNFPKLEEKIHTLLSHKNVAK